MRHERLAAGDVQARLARALLDSAAAAGIEAVVGDHRQRPWASATFVGASHQVILAASRGEGSRGWVAALPEAELALRGHVVAGLSVDRIEDDGERVMVALAVLTIEDG